MLDELKTSDDVFILDKKKSLSTNVTNHSFEYFVSSCFLTCFLIYFSEENTLSTVAIGRTNTNFRSF
jgi:hypothetical protein